MRARGPAFRPRRFTYQWERCDGAGANCADIGTATAATYLPVAADIGSTLRVKVSASNRRRCRAGRVRGDARRASQLRPGGGGGGGGSGIPPDVVASISASPSNPANGEHAHLHRAGEHPDRECDRRRGDRQPAVAGDVRQRLRRSRLRLHRYDDPDLRPELPQREPRRDRADRHAGRPSRGPWSRTASLTTTPGDTNTANNTATSTIVISPSSTAASAAASGAGSEADRYGTARRRQAHDNRDGRRPVPRERGAAARRGRDAASLDEEDDDARKEQARHRCTRRRRVASPSVASTAQARRVRRPPGVRAAGRSSTATRTSSTSPRST